MNGSGCVPDASLRRDNSLSDGDIFPSVSVTVHTAFLPLSHRASGEVRVFLKGYFRIKPFFIFDRFGKEEWPINLEKLLQLMDNEFPAVLHPAFNFGFVILLLIKFVLQLLFQ
jgi:hypothetical protein